MEVSGQLHAPAALPPGKEAPSTPWTGGWVGPRAVLDVVVKRKIPSPRRKSNPRTPIVQPVDQRYADWTITDVLTKYKDNFTYTMTAVVDWQGNWSQLLSETETRIYRNSNYCIRICSSYYGTLVGMFCYFNRS
jgi:hypothetical protein